ncbi:hypothetical protein TVAG_020520 [Trichomonas vaginalis G3]|uniref:RRM domain-containing protein n=1 Tax=Trichomonas vaginalis (strain ATCC PRA-98 / G3) TaxID=412133 RepID=A2EXW6_TRIV3|nr:RNA-binding domain, RBD family-containing protein [Trichomonas vaginalis G3]EAY02499.1 hypothetical protein TVAG_020520 [Trichomonas vaginalis G3]KAI5529075.1 RNA-binding domain, RBD family-containing protein [Trichomonas vaginalis G3]|eukprot:XP_001314738.1 hypothetical protein [Trichomonas vaginalis G3]
MTQIHPIENPFPYEGRILLLTNLPNNVSPTQVRDFLISKGRLLRVDLEKDCGDRISGRGFAEFNNPDDCQSALDLNGTQFGRNSIYCMVADHPPPELTRYYLRQPINRPTPDKIRQKMINEINNPNYDPQEVTNIQLKKRHMFMRRRRTQQLRNSFGENQEFDSDYSDYSDSSSESYSD